MNVSLVRKALLGIAALVALIFALFGIFFAILDFRLGFIDGGLEPKIAFFLECLGILGAIAVLAGLYLTPQAPHAGMRLVMVGAITMAGAVAGLQHWLGGLSVVAAILALLVLVIGFARTKRLPEEGRLS